MKCSVLLRIGKYHVTLRQVGGFWKQKRNADDGVNLGLADVNKNIFFCRLEDKKVSILNGFLLECAGQSVN